jgi:hypothetical protein
MPAGSAIGGRVRRAAAFSTSWIRRSVDRTESRDSSSFRRSAVPSRPAGPAASSRTASSTLRVTASPRGLPNSLWNTARGFFSTLAA